MGISRVRKADNLLLAQAFAPCLFRMGPQAGPHLLLQWLQGRLRRDALRGEWERLHGESADKKLIKRIDDLRLPCACCKQDLPVPKFPHAVLAGVVGHWHPALVLLENGAGRKC